jgi:glycosyltransferase involved in cell wall biosynthesis
MPLFSVVIPTLERRQLLLQAVESVKRQIFPAYEVIVVSDGGTDDSAQAVADRWPDVAFIRQPNLGRAVACNTGIARATGDWICFLDDDDLWHEEKLQVTANYIAAHPEAEAINNPIWFFGERDDSPAGAFGFRRDFVARDLDACHACVANGDPSLNDLGCLHIHGNSYRLLLERNCGVMSASVVHRETLIRAGGFCPMQAYTDDWTLFVNIARLTEWHTLPRRLGFQRLHRNQSSAADAANLYNVLNILCGQVNAWYGGRPMPHRIRGLQMINELALYGPVYRSEVQGYLWHLIRCGHFRLALIAYRLGRLLLPRMRDRAFALTPPQLTWRWERYVLGKHRSVGTTKSNSPSTCRPPSAMTAIANELAPTSEDHGQA